MSSLKGNSVILNQDFFYERAFYKPFSIGMLMAAAGYFLLNQARRRMSGDFYRVMVDVVVVIPVVVFWVLVRLDGNPMT